MHQNWLNRHLQKSIKFLEQVIFLVAMTEPATWEIDTHRYTDKNIKALLGFKQNLIETFAPYKPTDILVIKIMLGIFGNVPAFDTYFKRGFGVSHLAKRH